MTRFEKLKKNALLIEELVKEGFVKEGFIKSSLLIHIEIYERFQELSGTKESRYEIIAEEQGYSSYTSIKQIVLNLNKAVS